jgi:hypothetical protein
MVEAVIDSNFETYWDCITEPMLTEHSVDFKILFREYKRQVWIYAFSLFTSRNFYSANFDEKDKLRGLVEQLANGAKHESEKKSLFDLVVLRTVWNMIDIGEANVLIYKHLANLFLVIHLACSIATIFVVTLADQINQLFATSAAGHLPSSSIVVYIAVTNTAVASMNALINPSVRWRQVLDDDEIIADNIY